MYYSTFSTPATEHGKKFEGHVRSQYLETMIQRGYQNITITDAGLKISDTCSFLGASLDGLVYCGGEKWGLEIKCPYSKYQSTLASALSDKKFFLKEENEVRLKRSRKTI